jgi:hypothetical protein
MNKDKKRINNFTLKPSKIKNFNRKRKVLSRLSFSKTIDFKNTGVRLLSSECSSGRPNLAGEDKLYTDDHSKRILDFNSSVHEVGHLFFFLFIVISSVH